MFDFFSKKFSGILNWASSKTAMTKEDIEQATAQVREALLEADVPYNVVEDFLSEIATDVSRANLASKQKPGDHLIRIVHDKMLSFLGDEGIANFQIPSTIMMMGLQGSGKTTTIAKLAHWIKHEARKKNKQRKILFASVDFNRPAAVEQLKILSEQVSVDFYASQSSDPLTAACDAHAHAKAGSYDFLFLDTAGRLHVDNTMMQELQTIDAALAPKHKLLVLDAMTGQESLRVAEAFEQSIGFNGAILSKMDSDARGGGAFAFRYVLKKPILFVGSGEKPQDLERFIPKRMVGRMLGMGDLQTLLEHTDEKIDTKTQAHMTSRMMQGTMTLEDFAQQLSMVSSLGPIEKLLKYMPGAAQVSADKLQEGKKEMTSFQAIMSSMTSKERSFPAILDASRMKRIAKGSGTSVELINKMLDRFEQMKQFAKIMRKGGSLTGLLK